MEEDGKDKAFKIGPNQMTGGRLSRASRFSWWLRSPNVSNANNVYYVQASGASNNNNANNANGVSPDYARPRILNEVSHDRTETFILAQSIRNRLPGRHNGGEPCQRCNLPKGKYYYELWPF